MNKSSARATLLAFCLSCVINFLPSMALAAPAQRYQVHYDNVAIEVLAEGAGPVIVMLPSLARGAEDYDEVAQRLAAQGFRVLRPQPRGIGGSVGPLTNLTLHDFANDVARVIEHQGSDPVIVVGHAYGAGIVRVLAADYPGRLRGVVLAAAGRIPKGYKGPGIAPEMRVAIIKSHDLALSDAERLHYLQMAFFAPGNDPRVWLAGWHPQVSEVQSAALAATPMDSSFVAGTMPILDLQAEQDTVAPPQFSQVLKDALGSRVTVQVIKNAGHALAPEQPKAMSDAIAAFARSIN